ncbi:MAG: inositol monophosphatase [Alphaproteobacteria bacterium]|nr:inositol monophosphatase [Alphaproteobacteria bacterium]MBV8547936.1 inositol monophosphatase [Alphaproteobacteria bacterium]
MALRSALLNVMVKAADKAAKSLKRDFGEVEHLQISRKGPADFVSTADMQAQRILREELGKARPNFGFLAEEKDSAPDTSGKSERWIIDPLDGTTNFLHAVPHWAISIAAEREGEVIAGVVYDAAKDEMFVAEKGVGAYLNNKRLRVSSRSDLADCLIATGTPFKGTVARQPRYIEKLATIMSQVSGIRRFGSAALDLAYVAAGRFDGYWEEGLGTHDVAAGILLVKEAGGFVVPVDTTKQPVADGNIIATNQGIHATLVDLLRKA